jgi:hypothetical protein
MPNRIPPIFLLQIDITNRFYKAAEITVLPTLWFYNGWNVTRSKTGYQPTQQKFYKSHPSQTGRLLFVFPNPKRKVVYGKCNQYGKVLGIPNKSPFVKTFSFSIDQKKT